jgi:endonuclease YncB( thermonuclease family)
MKVIRILFLLALSLVSTSRGSASSLSGKVTEIIDGGKITIVSLNHPIRVRIIGITPPEKNQPYSEIAKQHLSDFVLNKYVVVRYTTLERDGYLNGKVLLNDLDVGEQMIRDGVAWYDKSESSSLSETEQQLYTGCEQAARSERRGLWQDESPTSPWEFRKAQIRQQSASLNAQPPSVQGASKSRQYGLSNESLLRTLGSTSTSSPSGSVNSRASDPSDNSQWIKVKLPGSKLSVVLPRDGIQNSSKVPLGDGREADGEIYMGRFAKTAYAAFSITAPSIGESDDTALSATIPELIAAIKGGYESHGGEFSCQPKLMRQFSFTYYAAREYDLSTCSIPGTLRAYTKVSHNVREMYIMMAFFFGPKNDPNAVRFFDSLTVE